MNLTKLLLVQVIIFFINHSLIAQESDLKVIFKPQTTDTEASFRGLCIVSPKIVWVSGTQGTILRTQNGGDNWEKIIVKGFEDKDFRDIHAFDSKTAIIINAGSPAYILRTENGGQTWQKVYENNTKMAFLDDLAFADQNFGLVFGDPDESGYFLTLQTKDGGKSWIQNNLFFPKPLPSEGGFAASGSILQMQKKHIWLATSGEKSRFFYSADAGKTWVIQETPILKGKNTQGIFSICISPTLEVIAVGGDYANPKDTLDNAIFTKNKREKWSVAQKMPLGYRSGVARTKKGVYICVGTTGCDISKNDGQTWHNINQENLNAIRFDKNKNIGWAVGSKGKVFKIQFK